MYVNVGFVWNYLLFGFIWIFFIIDKLYKGGVELEISERMGGMLESVMFYEMFIRKKYRILRIC